MPFTDAVQVAAGSSHTCALRAAGTVQCWGDNSYGQLGDGSTTSRSMGLEVSGLTDVTAIAAGSNHTCALTEAGAVLCWGGNSGGQLGDGSTSDRLTPTAVSGLGSGVDMISTGGEHTCALTDTGALCWGANWSGQLGDGSTTTQLIPTAVSGLSAGVSSIATGYYHTCAVTDAGVVLCWGYNETGQLGDGSTSGRLTPTAVSGLNSVVSSIATGYYHTCAVTDTGAVLCWGGNGTGQLGDGSNETRLTPMAVSSLTSGVTSIAAGNDHTCALTDAGAVLCWGANQFGQLGDGNTEFILTPAAVSGLSSGASSITTGGYHTCAPTDAGAVLCWGDNFSGQLGDGDVGIRTTPRSVISLGLDVTGITAGYAHTCALTDAGAVLCWGANWNGQLGDGSTMQRFTPTAVSGLSAGITAIAAGGYHTCALTDAGAVLCWGANWAGQLGDGSTMQRPTPTVVSGLSSGATAIATGQDLTCALTDTGATLCWGWNSSGQLGDGSTTARFTPTAVSGLSSGVTAIAPGLNHTCALTDTGAALCWGANWSGQLGDGSTTSRLTPTAVSGLSSGVNMISTGGEHTCALTDTGAALCWGANWSGQLGDGSTTSRPTPTAVSGLDSDSGVTAIAAGLYHTCALTDAGAALCWGYNGSGQLGEGSQTGRLTPTAVTGPSSGVNMISTGGEHTCALRGSGAMLCWGVSLNGRLGDGSEGIQRVPVEALQLDINFIYANGFE